MNRDKDERDYDYPGPQLAISMQQKEQAWPLDIARSLSR